MNDAIRRISSLYRGESGRVWERIGRERPLGYLEENIVLGRREEAALLRLWIGEAPECRILDAGCGGGGFAARMARAGARVIASDLLPRFVPPALAAAGRRELALVAADFRDLLPAASGERFDVLLLRAVLQDYSAAERDELLRTLAPGPARRLLLTVPLESPWSHIQREFWPVEAAATLDPVLLLRRVHLLTEYRLVRQRGVRRRNFRSQVIEMELHEEPGG